MRQEGMRLSVIYRIHNYDTLRWVESVIWFNYFSNLFYCFFSSKGFKHISQMFESFIRNFFLFWFRSSFCLFDELQVFGEWHEIRWNRFNSWFWKMSTKTISSRFEICQQKSNICFVELLLFLQCVKRFY